MPRDDHAVDGKLEPGCDREIEPRQGEARTALLPEHGVREERREATVVFEDGFEAEPVEQALVQDADRLGAGGSLAQSPSAVARYAVYLFEAVGRIDLGIGEVVARRFRKV